MLYVLLLAVGVLLIGTLVAKIAARQDVRAEVERFHHARSITSGWARQGPASPPSPEPGEPDPAS